MDPVGNRGGQPPIGLNGNQPPQPPNIPAGGNNAQQAAPAGQAAAAPNPVAQNAVFAEAAAQVAEGAAPVNPNAGHGLAAALNAARQEGGVPDDDDIQPPPGAGIAEIFAHIQGGLNLANAAGENMDVDPQGHEIGNPPAQEVRDHLERADSADSTQTKV